MTPADGERFRRELTRFFASIKSQSEAELMLTLLAGGVAAIATHAAALGTKDQMLGYFARTLERALLDFASKAPPGKLM